MRLLLLRVSPKTACPKHTCEPKLTQLPAHPIAIPAAYQPEFVPPVQLRQHLACCSHQLRRMLGVKFAPHAVRLVPTLLRNLCCAVNRIPVWRIIPLQLGETPIHAHRAKHGEKSLGVRMVGIKEGAVPIEQHTVKHGPRSHCLQISRNAPSEREMSRELV